MAAIQPVPEKNRAASSGGDNQDDTDRDCCAAGDDPQRSRLEMGHRDTPAAKDGPACGDGPDDQPHSTQSDSEFSSETPSRKSPNHLPPLYLQVSPINIRSTASALPATTNRRILEERLREEKSMPRIKHIALTTKEPAKVADFYKQAFGMQEIRRAPNGAVFLTDGYINLAILNWKTEKSADVGANGPNYSGIHHFGFEVEDLDAAAGKLERAHGKRLEEKAGLDMEMAAGGHRNFEMKWAGPDGVVLDISHTGWETRSR
jgi:catechol 2,3-dioxygenase-like lactoylglutathione lyase family enzyme